MNLAFAMRPDSLDSFVGQEHLVGKGKIIRKMIESDQLFSIIFWGPPGTGKTTLANIIAKETNSEFYMLSAVTTGKEDLLKIIHLARNNEALHKRTILFIDEIHRWNKAQQDVLLPHVESGLIILIGATTENPSFEVNNALLSRSRIFVLKPLTESDLSNLTKHALTDQLKGLGKEKKELKDDAKQALIHFSGGDARVLLNALEIASKMGEGKSIGKETIIEVFQNKTSQLYDKKADEHYNTISAYIKSMRGSDIDASLYYLARLLENGEDPKFIARRMIIFCSEDIGMSDRGALIQANAGFEAVQKIGMPESQLILAHITVYLAKAKKSRAVTNALQKAKEAVAAYPTAQIPLHLRNAPTQLMKNMEYGKGYTWSDDFVGPKDSESFLPPELKVKKFFEE